MASTTPEPDAYRHIIRGCALEQGSANHFSSCDRDCPATPLWLTDVPPTPPPTPEPTNALAMVREYTGLAYVRLGGMWYLVAGQGASRKWSELAQPVEILFAGVVPE